jgi:diguanylate cyclase
MEELRRRLGSHGPDGHALVVAFIDLDQFKAINDIHGHDAGDRFLTAIGGRMQGAVRSDDFVARLGGDEFVVLSSPAHADALVVADVLRKRLQEATTGRFHLGELTLDYAGPSIGSIVSMSGEVEPEALLAQADAAMYEVKRERKQGQPAR